MGTGFAIARSIACFTRRGSQVQILFRPPYFTTFLQLCLLSSDGPCHIRVKLPLDLFQRLHPVLPVDPVVPFEHRVSLNGGLR